MAPSFEDASQQKLLSVQDLAALPKTVSTRDCLSQAVWPDFWPDHKGAPCFSRPSGKVASDRDPLREAACTFESDARALFQEFSEIVEACSLASEQAGLGMPGMPGMQIKILVDSSSAKVWAADVPGSSCGFTCSRIDLHLDMPPEAVMWAIYNVDERLLWDSASFEAYELLCEAIPQSCSRALGDVVYCRFPGMAGVSGRDVVQERFLLCPDHPVGGCAMVMKSPQPSRCALLGRPPQPGWVRNIAAVWLSHSQNVRRCFALDCHVSHRLGWECPCLRCCNGQEGRETEAAGMGAKVAGSLSPESIGCDDE